MINDLIEFLEKNINNENITWATTDGWDFKLYDNEEEIFSSSMRDVLNKIMIKTFNTNEDSP